MQSPSEDSLEGGPVSVEILWEITRSHQIEHVEISKTKHLLDMKVWEPQNDDPTIDVAPSEIIQNPTDYPSHWIRISNAKTEYPILVLWPHSSEYPLDVIDGLHRLVKHWTILKSKTVPIIRVSQGEIEFARQRRYPIIPLDRVRKISLQLKTLYKIKQFQNQSRDCNPDSRMPSTSKS